MLTSWLVAFPAIIGCEVGSIEGTNIDEEHMPCEGLGTMELDPHGGTYVQLLAYQHRITDQSIQASHGPLRSSQPCSLIQAFAGIQTSCFVCNTQPLAH